MIKIYNLKSCFYVLAFLSVTFQSCGQKKEIKEGEVMKEELIGEYTEKIWSEMTCYEDSSKYNSKMKDNIVKYSEIEKFDVEFLEKNGNENVWDKSYIEYRGKYKGNEVYMYSEKKGYFIVVDTSEYSYVIDYDLNGEVTSYKKESIYGFDILEYKINPNKEIVDEINYDKFYRFTISDVKDYMKRENINPFFLEYKSLKDSDVPIPHIYRGTISKYGYDFPDYKTNNRLVWVLDDVQYNDKGEMGIYYILLDGQTGEELLRKRYLGMGPDGPDTTIARYDIEKMISDVK